MSKVDFGQLEPGDIFDTVHVKGHEKIEAQEQGSYGLVNAVGPAQYATDVGYRFFHTDQLVTPNNKPTADRLRDTARSTIATIEQLASDLALIGQADLLTPAAARAMCAQLDDVVTGLLHKDELLCPCGCLKERGRHFCIECLETNMR